MDKLGQHPTTSSVEMGGSPVSSTPSWRPTSRLFFCRIPGQSGLLPCLMLVCVHVDQGACRTRVGGRIGDGPSVLVAGSCWRLAWRAVRYRRRREEGRERRAQGLRCVDINIQFLGTILLLEVARFLLVSAAVLLRHRQHLLVPSA